MKIIRNNEVSVQKRDLDVLTASKNQMPLFILLERYNHLSNNENPFDWISYHETEAIEYFSHIDWILDYDYVKTLKEKDIVGLFKKVMKRKKTIKKQCPYIEENEENIKNELKDLWEEYTLLEYQENALLSILLWKQGKFDMPLPEDVKAEEKTTIRLKLERLFSKKGHQ